MIPPGHRIGITAHGVHITGFTRDVQFCTNEALVAMRLRGIGPTSPTTRSSPATATSPDAQFNAIDDVLFDARLPGHRAGVTEHVELIVSRGLAEDAQLSAIYDIFAMRLPGHRTGVNE